MHRFIIGVVLLAGACKSDHRRPRPAEETPPPATRPAAISDVDVQNLDQLLATLTAINAAIRGEHDCAKAAAAVRDAAGKAATVFAAMAKLEERTHADKDVEAWAFASYGQQIKPLMEGISMHACATDPTYKATLAQLR